MNANWEMVKQWTQGSLQATAPPARVEARHKIRVYSRAFAAHNPHAPKLDSFAVESIGLGFYCLSGCFSTPQDVV
jgi:hypothetical protein